MSEQSTNKNVTRNVRRSLHFVLLVFFSRQCVPIFLAIETRFFLENSRTLYLHSYGLLYASRLYKCTIAIIIKGLYIYSTTNNSESVRQRACVCVDVVFCKWQEIVVARVCYVLLKKCTQSPGRRNYCHR